MYNAPSSGRLSALALRTPPRSRRRPSKHARRRPRSRQAAGSRASRASSRRFDQVCTGYLGVLAKVWRVARPRPFASPPGARSIHHATAPGTSRAAFPCGRHLQDECKMHASACTQSTHVTVRGDLLRWPNVDHRPATYVRLGPLRVFESCDESSSIARSRKVRIHRHARDAQTSRVCWLRDSVGRFVHELVDALKRKPDHLTDITSANAGSHEVACNELRCFRALTHQTLSPLSN